MSKKIAAYMRISVDTEKDRDNTSIENQRRIIKAYIKQTFPDAEVDFYEDRDRSGYTFEQRENYQRMRPLLMNGHYDILMIKDFSRFSRRNSRGLVELEDLRDAGVRIISIGDGIDYPTYDDWNNIQVRFLLNEMPVTDASKKVKRVVESRQNEGNWICAVPYGYYFVNTKEMIFEVDEAAAEVVREIFDLYIKGWGYKKIANYLTEKNIPTPRMVEKERKEAEAAKNKSKEEIKIKASSVWAIPTVSGILQNDFYIGTLRQRKYARKNINGADKKLDVEENKVFENHHPAIVDVKTFMKAQQQLKQRSISHYRGVKKYENEYSGFLFCGDCGSPMFSMSRPDLAPAYTCGTYHKRGLKGCTSHHIRLDTLDDLLKNYVERVMKNSEKMIAELEKAIKDEPQMMKSSASTIAKLEVELAKARESYKATQKQKIRELMKADGDNREIIEETYEEIETELLQKIDGLEKQLEMTVEHRNTRIEVNRIAKTALDIFRDFLEKDKLDKGDLSLIIDKIIVFENKEEGTNKIEIKLKADIQMLLETGTLTEEELEESGYRGKVVNFNWDIESNLSAQIVQKVRNQRDKAFGVNVICEGDPLEIFTDIDCIQFKKYSPVKELKDFAEPYAEALAKSTDKSVLITDKQGVIAAAIKFNRNSADGISAQREEFKNLKFEILQKHLTPFAENILEEGISYVYDGTGEYVLEGVNKAASVIEPIKLFGDILGAVVLLENQTLHATDADKKTAKVAADYLAKLLED